MKVSVIAQLLVIGFIRRALTVNVIICYIWCCYFITSSFSIAMSTMISCCNSSPYLEYSRTVHLDSVLRYSWLKCLCLVTTAAIFGNHKGPIIKPGTKTCSIFAYKTKQNALMQIPILNFQFQCLKLFGTQNCSKFKVWPTPE